MSTTPITDAMILAAIERAALHRGRPGVPTWMILEHLGLPRRARRVRPQIRALTDAGALATSRAHGVMLWSLTSAGRRQLGDSREAAVTLAAFWERWTTDSLFARRRSPRTSTIASGRRGSSPGMAHGRSLGSMTLWSLSGLPAESATARSRRCGPCSTMRRRRRQAALYVATRSLGLESHAVPVVGTNGRRVRSRCGGSSALRVSWQRRRLPHGCKSQRSRGSDRASWMRCVARMSIWIARASGSLSSSARRHARLRCLATRHFAG